MNIDYTLPLEELPDPLPIVPLTRPFDVRITPRGSKSITNRAYILAALAKGESRIVRPLRADDTDLLLDALCMLGVKAKWVDGDNGEPLQDVLITGVDGQFPKGGSVNLGDGGTPTRFLIAAACLAAEPVVVDGSKRMRERPISEGVDMLRQLGATIEYVEEDGRLPVRVVPSENFKGGKLEVDKTQSSQFISAIMLIGAWLEKGVEFRFAALPTSSSYLTLTRHVLGAWREDLLPKVPEGSRTRQSWCGLDGLGESRIVISPGPLQTRSFKIEPDASSAAYWFTAAWINPPARLLIDRFSHPPIQSDLRVLLELKKSNMIDLEFSMFDRSQGFVWELTRGRRTGKLRCDCSLFPDGAMALIAGSATLRGKSKFSGLHTLRVKECDRLEALATELRKVGCEVETTDDSITIHPIPEELLHPIQAVTNDRREVVADRSNIESKSPPSIIINTYNDHRMAMAFAILGLRVPGIAIENPAVVSKSYPTFWQDFAKLYE